MRIRNYKLENLPTIVQIQQAALQTDGSTAPQPSVEAWLENDDAEANAFVVTDDDDELHGWGQAGTLDGLEGEVAGYTTLTLFQDETGYHFLCQGTVHPQQRGQGAGRLLLVGALNRARILAAEFEFEAEQEGIPIYFEVLLPLRDTSSSQLIERCEMQAVEGMQQNGMQLYRRELW
jgi:GNAT superfamily N-acetyltransferase